MIVISGAGTVNIIPRKKVSVKSSTPWITQDFQQDIKTREHHFRKAKYSCSRGCVLKYKSLRNAILNKTQMAKKSILKFWQVLKSPRSLGSSPLS